MDVKDALVLEAYEQTTLRNKRTRAAIRDTYGPPSPTKKRRKLPGKRSWKNKSLKYRKLEGKMTMKEFNQKKKAMKVFDKVFAQKEKEAQKKQQEQLKAEHGKRLKHSLTE